MRSPAPGVSVRFWVVTRAPSAKRLHSIDAPVAVTLCRRIGVVQPPGPPSVRVTFGKKNFGAGDPVAVYPIALSGLITLTAAAIVPLAEALNVNSPSVRQPGDA